MMMPKPGLFAEIKRDNRRSMPGKPLAGLNKHVDFSVMEDEIDTDRSYPSAEREATLTASGCRVQIRRKGSANKPISKTQNLRNRRIATPRALVELKERGVKAF